MIKNFLECTSIILVLNYMNQKILIMKRPNFFSCNHSHKKRNDSLEGSLD